MAASFNATAWRLMGATAGVEMRALYNVLYANSSSPALGLTSWGPTINLLRDTRWGRSQESVSEDPLVSGVYAAEVSKGLQNGGDPRGFLLTVSGLKHFAAYSLEQYGPPNDPAEWTRQTFNAEVSPFDAADSYFPAFKRAIQDGGAAGVMYAVNDFNGVPGCLSSYLRGVLESWGFDGYRCTDGGQISQAVALHKYVPTLDQAIGYAAAAQSDIADGNVRLNIIHLHIPSQRAHPATPPPPPPSPNTLPKYRSTRRACCTLS
jgi:beta-glucosidase-like glycosyl hydrolase